MLKKKEAIEKANIYIKVAYSNYAYKVKVPTYTKRWKIWLLNKVRNFNKKRADIFGGIIEHEPGISNIDYSKVVYPDSWVISHAGHIAIGAEELKYIYLINLTTPFLMENLKYGMKPIAQYDLSFFQKPTILVDKNTGDIYDLGLVKFDKNAQEDFEKYKEDNISKVNWNKYIQRKPYNVVE